MAFTLELVGRNPLTSEVFELVFKKPEQLIFKPGQHIRFLHEGLERDYTPVSLSGDDTLCLCVAGGPPTGFSHVLCTCDMGKIFEVAGPFGHFLCPPIHAEGPPVVFIATGTGIAPFVSFARSGFSGYILLQGARTPEDLLYKDEVCRNSSFYVPCLSHPGHALCQGGFHGRVTNYLEQVLPKGSYQFYLCGHREMILETMDIIDDKFPDARVFTERFS